jgi:DNA-binding IclR family transcriptional regulator
MQWDTVATSGTAKAQRRLVNPVTGGSPVGSLARGIAAIELLASRESASVSEIAELLGLSRSTAYRLMATLEGWGWVEPAGAPGRLKLGIKAAEVGAAAIATVDITRVVGSYLRQLADEAQDTVFFAVFDVDAMVYLHVAHGDQPVQLSARMGSRRPLHATGLGKAYLSALPEVECRKIVAGLNLVPLTPGTITSQELLEQEIAATRIRGYAIDNEEGELGVACVAAPILGRTGTPVGAISVAGPVYRVLPRSEQIGPLVAGAANHVSTRLGATDRRPALQLPTAAKQSVAPNI